MRRASLLVSLSLLPLLADPVLAQGGGGGGRWRQRADEILNRVGAFFADVKGPLPDGDKAGDLATTDLIKAASGAGQPAVLYLVDSSDDQDVRDQFERALFANDELGIELRCFHCGRIDLKAEPLLAAKFQKQAPLFVVFDKDGKVVETVPMSGYKPSAKGLETGLLKAAQGVVKPSLAAFAKDYGSLVRDLEQAMTKTKTAKERLAKVGGDKAKRAEVEKDVAALEKEEQKLLVRETDMVTKMNLPARPADAKRLGAGRGGRG